MSCAGWPSLEHGMSKVSPHGSLSSSRSGDGSSSSSSRSSSNPGAHGVRRQAIPYVQRNRKSGCCCSNGSRRGAHSGRQSTARRWTAQAAAPRRRRAKGVHTSHAAWVALRALWTEAPAGDDTGCVQGARASGSAPAPVALTAPCSSRRRPFEGRRSARAFAACPRPCRRAACSRAGASPSRTRRCAPRSRAARASG